MPNAEVKLLIVDDEVSIRTSLSELFSALGYCVRSAGDGRSALSEIQREIPEILLSDLNMPGMSGFEFLPMVRSLLPEIHVVAMSGAFSGTCVPPGIVADAFFAKGSDPAFLIKTVVLLCYKVDTTLKELQYLCGGMVIPCLHERQVGNFRRPAATADELP
jgi:CheY-like chemotaxis protein